MLLRMDLCKHLIINQRMGQIDLFDPLTSSATQWIWIHCLQQLLDKQTTPASGSIEFTNLWVHRFTYTWIIDIISNTQIWIRCYSSMVLPDISDFPCLGLFKVFLTRFGGLRTEGVTSCLWKPSEVMCKLGFWATQINLIWFDLIWFDLIWNEWWKYSMKGI